MVGDEAKKAMTNRRAAIVGTAAAVAGVGIGVAAGRITEADASTVDSPFTVVDRRGKQRFLLATRKPPIILGGKTYPEETRGGPDDGTYLIFNDDNGDEKGGIVALSEIAVGGQQSRSSIEYQAVQFFWASVRTLRPVNSWRMEMFSGA
ncbi:hypothetical protein ACFWF7_31845 [Nocardia sp. NPDC060256]|uniref:hypothetical protein n=1 Tax=unclassified Nocardia TaxID=2637762 RepID=UPI003659975C